jgi:hypothetical protein
VASLRLRETRQELPIYISFENYHWPARRPPRPKRRGHHCAAPTRNGKLASKRTRNSGNEVDAVPPRTLPGPGGEAAEANAGRRIRPGQTLVASQVPVQGLQVSAVWSRSYRDGFPGCIWLHQRFSRTLNLRVDHRATPDDGISRQSPQGTSTLTPRDRAVSRSTWR